MKTSNKKRQLFILSGSIILTSVAILVVSSCGSNSANKNTVETDTAKAESTAIKPSGPAPQWAPSIKP